MVVFFVLNPVITTSTSLRGVQPIKQLSTMSATTSGSGQFDMFLGWRKCDVGAYWCSRCHVAVFFCHRECFRGGRLISFNLAFPWLDDEFHNLEVQWLKRSKKGAKGEKIKGGKKKEKIVFFFTQPGLT